MKSLRLAAAVAILALTASGAFAGGTPRLVPHQGGPVSKDPSSTSGTSACFDVYCDDAYSGYMVCGDDLRAIIDTAIWICS
jgi:hypothetical protein